MNTDMFEVIGVSFMEGAVPGFLYSWIVILILSGVFALLALLVGKIKDKNGGE